MGGLTLTLLLLQTAHIPDHLKDAAALVDRGNYQDARKALSQLDPKLPGVLHLQGVVFYNLRDYAAASKTLREAAATEREGTAAYRESSLLIGQSEFLLSRYKDAVSWLEKARASGSPSTEVSYMLGVANIHLQAPEKATTAFAELYGVTADSPAALLLTAQMMFRFEHLPQAEPLLRRALERNPSLPGAHQLLGEIATARNDTDAAIAEFNAELKLNPNSAVAYYKLGDAYTRREDWEHAMPALQKSVWLHPYNSGPYILLGKGYFRKQEFANAEGMLRRALQMDPNNTSAHYLLGQTLLRLGKSDEGRELLKRSRQ